MLWLLEGGYTFKLKCLYTSIASKPPQILPYHIQLDPGASPPLGRHPMRGRLGLLTLGAHRSPALAILGVAAFSQVHS